MKKSASISNYKHGEKANAGKSFASKDKGVEKGAAYRSVTKPDLCLNILSPTNHKDSAKRWAKSPSNNN